MNKLTTIMAASLALVLGTVPSSVLAQEDAATYSDVRIMQIKFGRTAEFEELIARMVEARDAMIGSPPLSVWNEVRGNVANYHTVRTGTLKTLFDDVLAVGPPLPRDEWESLTSRLRDTFESQQRLLVKHDPELSIPAAEDSEPARYIQLKIHEIAWGGNAEYSQWLREDLIPTLADAGVQRIGFSRVIQGDNPHIWITAREFDNWVELDEPGALADLSAKEIQQIVSTGNDLTLSGEVIVLRRVY